jgi:hypothetical protein
LIYEIFETTEEHNHDNITERKTGLTSRQKEIVIRRINGLEAVNAEACLQAFRNEGIRSLPTTLQVRNFVYQQKQKSGVAHGKLSFMDIDKMVERVGGEPAIVDFKYKIDARNPKKTDFSIIITCQNLVDQLRSQNHFQIDGTHKLITDQFIVMIWGFSDKLHHFHPCGNIYE